MADELNWSATMLMMCVERIRALKSKPATDNRAGQGATHQRRRREGVAMIIVPLYLVLVAAVLIACSAWAIINQREASGFHNDFGGGCVAFIIPVMCCAVAVLVIALFHSYHWLGM